MEVFIIMLLVGGVVVFFAIKQANNANEAWAESATKLRLNFEKENLGRRRIYGERVDLRLNIRTDKVGKAIWTTYQAEFVEPFPFPLTLRPQNFFSDVKNALLDRVDLETGDPAFDVKVIVESPDAEKVREFLDERARAAIMNLLSRFDSFEMTDDRILVTRKRLVSNRSQIVDDVRLLEASARKIRDSGRKSPEPQKVPPPLPKKNPVEVLETEEEAEVVEEGPEFEASPDEELAHVFEPVVEAEEVEETVPVTSPEEVESEPPVSETAPESTVFAMHCRELFADCQGHYDMVKIFNEELKGSEVDDKAILERAEPYSMDRVFGRGPGVRRNFSYGPLEDGEDLRIVANSRDGVSIRDMQSREGTVDLIQGRFVAFDSFSRTLFVKILPDGETVS